MFKFKNRGHAKTLVKQWTKHYNSECGHLSLSCQTPIEFPLRRGDVSRTKSRVSSKNCSEKTDRSARRLGENCDNAIDAIINNLYKGKYVKSRNNGRQGRLSKMRLQKDKAVKQKTSVRSRQTFFSRRKEGNLQGLVDVASTTAAQYKPSHCH